MRKSGIIRAREYWRRRKSTTQEPHTNVSEISSRGTALTDADLAIVIGGTEERSEARARVNIASAQPLGCCLDGRQTELPAYLYGKRTFQ